MKIIKYLLAAVAVSCAFTATAFATELSNDHNYTFSLTATPDTVKAGDTISVSVYLSATDSEGNPVESITASNSNNMTLSIGLDYNDEVLTWADTEDDGIATDTLMDNWDVYYAIGQNKGNNTLVYQGRYAKIGAITPTTALVTYKFTVKEGVASATYDASNPLFKLVSGSTAYSNANTVQETTKKTMAPVNTITVQGSGSTGSTTVAGVAGKDLTGLDAGYKTFSAPAYVEMTNSADNKITVTKDGASAGSQEYEFGKDTIGVVGGKVKVLPIVSYQIGRNGVAAGDVFTITLMNGETAVQTITYTVPSAE